MIIVLSPKLTAENNTLITSVSEDQSSRSNLEAQCLWRGHNQDVCWSYSCLEGLTEARRSISKLAHSLDYWQDSVLHMDLSTELPVCSPDMEAGSLYGIVKQANGSFSVFYNQISAWRIISIFVCLLEGTEPSPCSIEGNETLPPEVGRN